MNLPFTVKDQRGFFSFVGLMLAVILVCFLFFIAFQKYYSHPVVDSETLKEMKSQDVPIDSSTPKSVLESTTAQIKKIEQQQLDRPQEIIDMMSGKQ